MEKFKMNKSKKSNIPKTIRFSEELNNSILKLVQSANKGKKKREYSFNGFVISACEYCIKNMDEHI